MALFGWNKKEDKDVLENKKAQWEFKFPLDSTFDEGLR